MTRLGRVGLMTTLLMGLIAAGASWIAPFDPAASSIRHALEPPQWGHVFGRDELGRDVLSRVIHGGRTSLLIGGASVLGGLAVGGAVGMLAGYRKGWTDALLMRVVEVPQVFSGFILAIWTLAVLGPGLPSVVLALALRAVPLFARLSRNTTLAVRERAHVEAAIALGGGTSRILWRHVMPNLTPLLLAVAAPRVGSTILLAASLGFLGLGVPPEVPEWGAMVKNGMSYMRLGAHHLVVFPGLTILVTVLGLNLLGDDLGDSRRRAGTSGRLAASMAALRRGGLGPIPPSAVRVVRQTATGWVRGRPTDEPARSPRAVPGVAASRGE